MKIIENGVVSKPLFQLMVMQGLAKGMLLEAAAPPEVVNEVLQEHWVKAKDGVWRAQLGGRFPTEEELALLKELGADAIPINFGVKYNGTLLLGATLKSVTRRMKFMFDEELDRQKRFRQQFVPQPVYFLGSTRVLDPKQEMPEHVSAILQETGARFDSCRPIERSAWPTTEIEMMVRVHQWMWFATNTCASWATDTICALPGNASDGKARPANTAETVKEWLRTAKPGHYLVVSSQPFCENQLMAVERAVKEAGKEGYYTFDVCGPEAPPLPLSRWLDNLAKQLWEEVQLLGVTPT